MSGDDLHEALLHGKLPFRFPERGVLLSVGPVADKYWFADEARVIAQELKLPICATHGTADMLKELGIDCASVDKFDGHENSAPALIKSGRVDPVINVLYDFDEHGVRTVT